MTHAGVAGAWSVDLGAVLTEEREATSGRGGLGWLAASVDR